MNNSDKAESGYVAHGNHGEMMPKNISLEPNRKLFSQILTLKFLYPDKKE